MDRSGRSWQTLAARSSDDVELFNEYKPGLRAYSLSRAAGSYKLNVSRKHVTIEFHAGDSRDISHTFVLR